MKKLTVDTTVAKVAKIKILEDQEIISEASGESPLPTIETALQQANLKLSDIDQFDSVPGPGSFTGIRIGAAVANTLNFANGLKFELIEPIYE